MPFTLKEGAATEGLPTVVLDGAPYYVARLPLRHRIEVQILLPKIMAIGARLTPLVDDIKAGAVTGFEVSREEYTALIDVVSNGLLPLYPGATREALLAEPIDFEELYAAWPVIVRQGASRRPPAGEA